MAANQTPKLALPLDTVGLEAFRQAYEAAMAKLDAAVTVMPPFTVADVGKVLKLEADGAGGARLAWAADAV